MAGIGSMFQQPIVIAITQLLSEQCKDGGVCKRVEIHALLTEKFSLPGNECQDMVLRAAVEDGVFNHGEVEYGNFKGGRGGCATGVREVDVTALRKAEETRTKRQANAAKAREVRAANIAARQSKAAETKVKRQANAAKAREARAANIAARKATEATTQLATA